MSAEQSRSEAEIQAEIELTRQQLAASLSSLSHELQPEVQLGYLKEAAQDKKDSYKEQVLETFTLARQGDRDAIIRIAATAGALIAVTTLTVRHHSKKSAKRRAERREIRQWRQFLRNLSRNQPPASVEFTVQ